MSDEAVTRLYPAPMSVVRLHGLFLNSELRGQGASGLSYVYTNFVASLDGRIAVKAEGKKRASIPGAITNPRDWRLYQELSAQADVIVVSAGHARAMPRSQCLHPFPFCLPVDACDLKQWRLRKGLEECPALAIVSASMALPVRQLAEALQAKIICLTGRAGDEGRKADAETAGVSVLTVSQSDQVSGAEAVDGLFASGFRYIYSVAGGGFMRALLQDGVLDRLYLTQVDRFIGGVSFESLVSGESLSPPVDACLVALYQDSSPGLPVSQTYAVYEIVK